MTKKPARRAVPRENFDDGDDGSFGKPMTVVHNGFTFWLRKNVAPKKPPERPNGTFTALIRVKHWAKGQEALAHFKDTGAGWNALAAAALAAVLTRDAEELGWVSWPIETVDDGRDWFVRMLARRLGIKAAAAKKLAFRGAHGFAPVGRWSFGSLSGAELRTFLEWDDEGESEEDRFDDEEVTLRGDLSAALERAREALEEDDTVELLWLPSIIRLLNPGDEKDDPWRETVPAELAAE